MARARLSPPRPHPFLTRARSLSLSPPPFNPQQDPGMASLMASMQAPDSQAEVERRLAALKADPELEPIMAEIEAGGPAAMMKYWDDPVILEKLSKAMGSAFAGGGPGGGAVAAEGGGGALAAAPAEGEDGGEAADPDTIIGAVQGEDAVGHISALLEGKTADEKAALINAKDGEGRTGLHLACGYGEDAAVRALLAAGADTGIADASGNTALHYAAGFDQASIVSILLEAGADVGATNADGQTPPVMAAAMGAADGLVDLFGPEAAAEARAAAAAAVAEEGEGGEQEGGEEAEVKEEAKEEATATE